MKISLSLFKSMIPRFSAHKISEQHAQVAENCLFETGDIGPVPADLEDVTLELTGNSIASIHRWNVGNDNYWLRFADVVSVARSPVADDAYSRIYWSGDSRMDGDVLYSYTPAVYTGGTEYPENYYKLGIPAPLTAPIAAISGTPPDNDNSEARYYVYTYVGKMGEEGPPSPVSDLVDVVNDGAVVNLSGLVIDGGISTGREITHMRIYRTVSGSTSADFMYVAQIAINQNTYTDSLDSDALGDTLVTTNYDPPRDAMQGLIIVPHGIAFGFVGKILCPSELFLPYAYPRSYELTMFDEIVSLGFYGYNVIVATKGRPVMVTGSDPSSLSQQELTIVESCASARSMVSMGWCAIYAGQRGLVIASGSDARLLTDGIFTEQQWKALDPSSIHAYDANGKYLFFYDNGTTQGAYLIDPARPQDGVVSSSDWYKAGYRDASTGALYLLDSDEVLWQWQLAETKATMRWKSKIFRMPRALAMSACRVRAQSYENLTITIYGDGEVYHTRAVTSDKAFRLPVNGRRQEWEIEVSGTDAVVSIGLAESVGELQR